MSEPIDVMYLAWNRLDFTKASFQNLIDNTPWEKINRLVVYDDTSEDGTTEWLRERVEALEIDCACEFRLVDLKSPPAAMNHFVQFSTATFFAKIDNDIMVPPGWLDAMLSVYELHPVIELLGMEAGRLGLGNGEPYDFELGSHTGGIGVFRRLAFATRPPIPQKGRFGFTEWQRVFRPVRGWIRPDLRIFSLDQLPHEPWRSLSEGYIERGWQRRWPSYDERWTEPYWSWWLNGGAA